MFRRSRKTRRLLPIIRPTPAGEIVNKKCERPQRAPQLGYEAVLSLYLLVRSHGCAKSLSRISVALLKPIGLFLICNVPREAVRAPFGGSAETGAGGVRRLLVPNLLNGGFGYENYLRFCP